MNKTVQQEVNTLNRDKLFQHLEQHYVSKREMISRIPLGVQPDEIWQEILNRRRANGTVLPLHSSRGTPYWYVTTQKMATASDRIITEMMENETDFDPYRNLPTTASLEESFFTSYVEGSQLTMQDAMTFIQGDMEPQSAEEQLILNNRNALNFISSNLYRPVSEEFINTIAGILNENMEIGGEGYRSDDYADIPSMTGLPYEVIRSFMIPNSVQEICSLIADPAIHPLIKASVAHAWALVARPFPDGNERLGRLLSQFILLRSGYHFFSEISLSSLIARKSYAYFNAMKNVLLPENGGDMTYFVEYFMSLLVDAVNERHLRLEARDSETIEADQEMAKQSLIASSPSSPPQSPSDSDVAAEVNTTDEGVVTGESGESKGGDYSYAIQRLKEQLYSPGKQVASFAKFLLKRVQRGLFTFTKEDVAKGLKVDVSSAVSSITDMRQKKIIKTIDPNRFATVYGFIPDSEARPEYSTEEDLRNDLKELAQRPSLTGRVGGLLLKYLDSRKVEFSYRDITADTELTADQAKKIIQTLLKQKYIKAVESSTYGSRQYTFNISGNSLAPNNRYSAEILEAIENLATYPYSPKDRRIGEALKGSLSSGVITKDTYDEKRWTTDMRLAEQIGLVEKVDQETYRILPEIRQPELSPGQKRTVTAMYENFGDEVFSQEMFMATLEYSDSHASAVLHELTLIRVLDCWREDSNRYRLNVNPETKPEYFEVA